MCMHCICTRTSHIFTDWDSSLLILSVAGFVTARSFPPTCTHCLEREIRKEDGDGGLNLLRLFLFSTSWSGRIEINCTAT